MPEFKASLVQSFARQPIDLAGSLGTVRIAIVAHGEPPWWRKVFKFGANDLVSDAFSIIGFPAVTSRALRLIDSFFEHLEEANPQVLIHSHPINVAFRGKRGTILI